MYSEHFNLLFQKNKKKQITAFGKILGKMIKRLLLEVFKKTAHKCVDKPMFLNSDSDFMHCSELGQSRGHKTVF